MKHKLDDEWLKKERKNHRKRIGDSEKFFPIEPINKSLDDYRFKQSKLINEGDED